MATENDEEHSSPSVDRNGDPEGAASSEEIFNDVPSSSPETDPRGLPTSQELEEAIQRLEISENTDDRGSILKQHGVTKLLHYAAAKGKIDALRIVLGADPPCQVNARDEQGRTALCLACSVGKADIVKLLLQKGADVMILYSDGYTCLHMAAFWGYIQIVKVLLDGNNHSESWKKCKALIDQKTSDEKFTALHMAAAGSHDQGAPIAAAILEALRASELFFQGLPPDRKVHFKIEAHGLLWLEFLLQVRNLLHLHGGEIFPEAISKSLLDYGKRGVGRKLKDLVGGELNYAGLVRTSVALVSFSNATDWNGRTALHHAALENNDDVVAFLMWDSGPEQQLGCVANVNMVDHRGFTALHCASKKGHEIVVEKLIGKPVLKFLLDTGLPWPLPHWKRTELDLSKLSEGLVAENYLQPNVKTNPSGQSERRLGCNQRERSAQPRWLPIVETTVWLEDLEGLTALHFAVEEEHEDVVEVLVRHPQTDVLMCSGDGLSPWAIVFELGINRKIQRLLRGAGLMGDYDSVKIHQQKLLTRAIVLATAAGKGPSSQEALQSLSLLELQICLTFEESLRCDPIYEYRGKDGKSNHSVFPVELVSHLFGEINAGISLLHVASYYGCWRELQSLLKFPKIKMQVNALERITSRNQSPLHFAIDSPETMAVLLEEKTLNPLLLSGRGASVSEFLMEICRLFDRDTERIKAYLGNRDGKYDIRILRQVITMLTSHPLVIENFYRDRQVYVDAVNAILVGAALIASVTYAGYLQPPLGYVNYFTDYFPYPAPPSTPESFAAVAQHLSVSIFWVFNGLSFFSAIATVLVGAGAVLPSSDSDIETEVRRVRKWLKATAGLLAISILCILGAFTAAGSASLPNIVKYQWNIIVTAIIGLMLCSAVFFAFCYRFYLSIRVLRELAGELVRELRNFVVELRNFVWDLQYWDGWHSPEEFIWGVMAIAGSCSRFACSCFRKRAEDVERE
ncbi:unnamed protein product [Calypogeia fissa]